MTHLLRATVDSFEENLVVLLFDDGEKVVWPKDKLPYDVKEGQIVWLSFFKEAAEKQKKLAKEILNEILLK